MVGVIWVSKGCDMVKVLWCWYSDKSGYDIVRVYLEKDFVQAESDLKIMKEFASDSRKWELKDVELFGSRVNSTVTD